jgi:hypothetical protein
VEVLGRQSSRGGVGCSGSTRYKYMLACRVPSDCTGGILVRLQHLPACASVQLHLDPILFGFGSPVDADHEIVAVEGSMEEEVIGRLTRLTDGLGPRSIFRRRIYPSVLADISGWNDLRIGPSRLLLRPPDRTLGHCPVSISLEGGADAGTVGVDQGLAPHIRGPEPDRPTIGGHAYQPLHPIGRFAGGVGQ